MGPPILPTHAPTFFYKQENREQKQLAQATGAPREESEPGLEPRYWGRQC